MAIPFPEFSRVESRNTPLTPNLELSTQFLPDFARTIHSERTRLKCAQSKTASEVRCAIRMCEILEGGHKIDFEFDYPIDDVARRYHVHRDTVYKGVQVEQPVVPGG